MSNKLIYAFIQEIQEALDEQQNNLDSLLAHNQVNIPLAQPFAFESQIDTDTYPVNLSLKSTNESENNISNETVPLLAAPNEKENEKNHSEIDNNRRRKSNWTLTKDLINIKKEPKTPVRQISACFSCFLFIFFISAKNKTTSIKNFIKFQTKKFIFNTTIASNDNDTNISSD
jgi:hypothetical protein